MIKIKRGRAYKIVSTPDDMLLKSLGLRKDTKLKLMTKQPFRGPLVVKIGSRNIALCRSIASKIKVEEV
ncbi:MAG: FeoA family protein [Andreesenia angusta]|nr:FeoA family protein [Andreesenia angusta]